MIQPSHASESDSPGMQMVGLLLASLTDSIGVLYMLGGPISDLLVGVIAYAKLDVAHYASVRNQFCKTTAIYGARGFQSVVASALCAWSSCECAMGLFFMGSYIVTLPLLIRDVYDGTAVSLSWVNVQFTRLFQRYLSF